MDRQSLKGGGPLREVVAYGGLTVYNIMQMLTFFTITLPLQGSALTPSSGPWRLTFAPKGLENLSFFIEILRWAPMISQAQSTRAPFNILFLLEQRLALCATQ